MVQNQAGVIFNHNFRQERIECKTAGIVDDFSAMFYSKRSDFRFVGVDRNWNTELLFEPLQYRNQSPQFLGRGDSYTTRFGGFGTNIQNISA